MEKKLVAAVELVVSYAQQKAKPQGSMELWHNPEGGSEIIWMPRRDTERQPCCGTVNVKDLWFHCCADIQHIANKCGVDKDELIKALNECYMSYAAVNALLKGEKR